jgi:riboflavin kinase / FMN adenylyltransferase
MRLFRSLDEARGRFAPSAVTIGNFDGIHMGHRQLMERVKRLAAELEVRPSAVTFHPHPTVIVAPERAPKLLTTPEERAELMAREGIEQVLILPFDRSVAHLSPVEFAGTVLREVLGARGVVVGDNFHFGSRQAGNTETLRELGSQFGFEVDVVAPVTWRHMVVSSSMIRRLLDQGAVGKAARLLQRPYALSGEVVRGEGRGTRETVPTLNLQTAAEILPADGVYITRTRSLDDRREWPSISNIGFRPTFAGENRTVETFLLEGLGGETPGRIAVELLHRLRGERKFDSAEALKGQILRDVARANTFFRRFSRLRQRAA